MAIRRAALPVVFALASVATPSRALDFNIGGDARVVEDYNTNIFLNPQGGGEAWGQGIDGAVNLSAAERNFNSNLVAKFQNRWYVGKDELNYYNQLFDWRNAYLTERSEFALDAQYNRVNTLTTLADQLANIGFVFRRIPRTDRILAPSWTTMLTERTQMKLGYEYRDSTYDRQNDSQANRFPNSVSNTATLNVNHQLWERFRLTGFGSYNDYALTRPGTSTSTTAETFFGPITTITSVPTETTDIRTAMAMGGFSWNLTNRIDLEASIGAQFNEIAAPTYGFATTTVFPSGQASRSVQPIAGIRSNTLAPLYSFKVLKRFETSQIAFEANRSISPNILGQLISYDRFAVNGEYRFTPELTAGLGLSYQDITYPAVQQFTNNDRQYISVYPTLNWQFERNWRINASYQYRYLIYQTTSQLNNIPTTTVDSQGVILTLTYIFDPHEL